MLTGEVISSEAEEFIGEMETLLPEDLLDIKKNEDISNREGARSRYMQPFKAGGRFGRNQRVNGSAGDDNTIFEALLHLAKIDSMLSWKLVMADCLKFGVTRVGTDGGYLNRDWERGLWAKYQPQEFGQKDINLNPHLDREEVAEQIRKEQGIDIEPDEIYYWLWFHEIGHIVYEKERNEAAQMEFNSTWKRQQSTAADREKYRGLMRSSEQKADEYANRRFLAWKSGCTGQKEA